MKGRPGTVQLGSLGSPSPWLLLTGGAEGAAAEGLASSLLKFIP